MNTALYHLNTGLILIMVPLFFLLPDAGTSVTPVLLLLLALFTLPWYVRNGVTHPELAFIVVVLLYFFVDVFDAYRGDSLDSLNTQVRFLIFIPVMFYLRRFSFNTNALWLTVFVGALAGALVGTYEVTFEGLRRASTSNFRIISFGNMGFFLGILSYAFLLALIKKEKKDWLYLGLATVGLLGGFVMVFTSGSRGPMFSYFIVLLLLPFLADFRFNVRTFVACLLLPIVALAIVFGTENTIKNKTINEVAKLKDYSPLESSTNTVIRLDMLMIGWQKFIENPIAGSGKKAVREYQNELADQGRFDRGQSSNYLHNDIADRAAYSGILGLATLFLLYALPIYVAYRKKNMNLEIKLALVCLTCYVFFAGLTNISLYRPDIVAYWSLFMVLFMQAKSADEPAVKQQTREFEESANAL